MIRRARRRESAAVSPWNFLRAVRANDFLDKIDIALQVAPITRDLPFCRLGRAGFLQSEPSENLIDLLRFNRDSEYAITFFVLQRNVSRIRWKFTGSLNFLCPRTASDLANQFRRALRCAKNHFRIDAALESITGVAR